MKHCLVFASLISPSKMILFEKKYQTFDTVFHHQMKHLEVRQKYSAARRIFNSLLGVSSGIFPNAWKRARVSPIFKEDLRTDPNNYRPISVLPVVSKLIERVVFNQLYEYLNNNNLLTESQSGFRPLKQLYLRLQMNGYGILTTVS